MLDAYTQLHERGVAHSIEVYDLDNQLVGGLYGVAIGRAFFGESMFSLRSDASKVAMVALSQLLLQAGFDLIDCQVESDHLNSLGATNVSRVDFERMLAHTVDAAVDPDIWTLPLTCGELL
jgi:leucyl/phenylalanyl-tRNA--protein transferase